MLGSPCRRTVYGKQQFIVLSALCLLVILMGTRAPRRMTVLAFKERSSQVLAATVVPRKFSRECASKSVVAWMRETGCDQLRISVTSDNNLAIVDLLGTPAPQAGWWSACRRHGGT